MSKVFLLLGGNLGDRKGNFERSKLLIAKQVGPIIKSSSMYETAPWGFQSPDLFLNQVIQVETDLNPVQVLSTILEIENMLGRKRKHSTYESRLIDIDILLYDDLIINTKELTIPHPEISNRMFTMTPLAEIAGDIIHPVFGKKILQLVERCKDNSHVTIYNNH